MNLDDNKQIKIPEQHYVGFQNRDSNVPLGFMIPEGNDAATTSKKIKVDQWASNNHYNRSKVTYPSKVIDNKPMSGFHLGKDIRRTHGWGKGTVQWRIEDPRGFELEITSPNLSKVLSTCTIENGEILDKCVWGRLGSENILIPVSSDVYKDAIRNTERNAKRVSLKDIKPGNHIVTRDGLEGIYLGNFHPVSRGYDKNQKPLRILDKKRAFIAEFNDNKQIEKLYAFASLKVSEIKSFDNLDIDNNIKLINAYLDDDNSIHTGGYYSTIGVVKKRITDNIIKLETSLITLSDALSNDTSQTYLIEKLTSTGSVFGLISSYSLSRPGSIVEIDIQNLRNDGEINHIELNITNPRSFWYNNREKYKEFQIDIKDTSSFNVFKIRSMMYDANGDELINCRYR